MQQYIRKKLKKVPVQQPKNDEVKLLNNLKNQIKQLTDNLFIIQRKCGQIKNKLKQINLSSKIIDQQSSAVLDETSSKKSSIETVIPDRKTQNANIVIQKTQQLVRTPIVVEKRESNQLQRRNIGQVNEELQKSSDVVKKPRKFRKVI